MRHNENIQIQGHRRTVIWQNVEKCKEGKVVENHESPVPSFAFFTQEEPLWRYVMDIISSKILRPYCHVDMTQSGMFSGVA
jgi:hypothetical protein